MPYNGFTLVSDSHLIFGHRFLKWKSTVDSSGLMALLSSFWIDILKAFFLFDHPVSEKLQMPSISNIYFYQVICQILYISIISEHTKICLF